MPEFLVSAGWYFIRVWMRSFYEHVLSVFLQLLRLTFCLNILIHFVVKQRVFCGFPKNCIAAVATVDLFCYLNVPSFYVCVVGWIVFMCSVFLHWLASEHIMYRKKLHVSFLYAASEHIIYRTKIACLIPLRSVWAYNIPDKNCVFHSSTQRLGI